MDIPHFSIHPSIHRPCAASDFWPIENNTVMNVGVRVSLHSLAFNSLEIYTEVDLLDHVVILFLCKGNTIVFYSICTNSAPRLWFLYIFTTIYYFYFFFKVDILMSGILSPSSLEECWKYKSICFVAVFVYLFLLANGNILQSTRF